MKAFVTGATGFIGGALARRLLADGWDLRALVRSPARARDLQDAGAELVVGDVLAPDTFRPALNGVDALFHAAATVDVVKPKREQILAINVDGTRNVLEAALEASVPRAVHVSSVAAIGRGRARVDESVWNDGHYSSLYEESKHRSEQVALDVGRRGLDIVQVLPAVVIGPGDPKTGAFFKRYLQGRIPGAPRSPGTISLVHVDDLVEGILRAYRTGQAGARYIFSQATWPIEEFMDEIQRATGVPRPRRVPRWAAMAAAGLEELRAAAAGTRPRVSRAAIRASEHGVEYSSEKARRELGWNPADFGRRLLETLNYWKGEVERGA